MSVPQPVRADGPLAPGRAALASDRWEAARLLHCNEKTIRREIPVAIDELSEILLKVGLLEEVNSAREKSCQEGKTYKTDLTL